MLPGSEFIDPGITVTPEFAKRTMIQLVNYAGVIHLHVTWN